MKNILAVALLALAFLPTSAGASDGKAYTPVTSCVTSGGSASYSAGRLLNASTSSSMSVYCDLLVDSGDAYVFSQTEIWMLDQTSSGTVSCTQYSRYQSTSSYTTSSASASYPSGSGSTTTYTSSSPTELTISSGSGYSFTHSYPMWNYIACTIPAASSSSTTSGIISYYASEGS